MRSQHGYDTQYWSSFLFFFPAVDWIELSRGEFGVCMFLVAVSK